MGYFSILVGLALAIALLSTIPKLPKSLQVGVAIISLGIVLAGIGLSSLRNVPVGQVGVVKKNALGASLTDGKIIATNGEMGAQAQVLPPGWHYGYWPVIFDVSNQPEVIVPQESVGIVEALDGSPLAPGQLFASEVAPDVFKRMIDDPAHFLTDGQGSKGPQVNVLTPGKYRINPQLFKVTTVPALEVPQATVAVLKANFGQDPTIKRAVADEPEPLVLADDGEKGIRAEPLLPGKYPINTSAYTVTSVSTRETIVRFTAGQGALNQTRGIATPNSNEESEITVRTSDGFTFPVDVRIEYRIDPLDAPIVVAKLGDDDQPLLSKMNSTVRAVFRNNAESVKALDYVNQRSQQERQSLEMIALEMARVGVTVTAVRIGDVGNEQTLGTLLKTQTDREIALQEQETFQEQQRAAEQEKSLTRTQQEAEEERRLATAQYEVQIAEQAQQQRIIEAKAEAEAIEIRAQAQADAYRLIADQIGAQNAALMELMKIVGEAGINITPRVMVSGSGSGSETDAESTALIGTMLDTMISRPQQQENQ
ncbi:MAG: SPFH domain-containing protein [Planctomycetota bacterium]